MSTQLDFGVRFLEPGKGNFPWKEDVHAEYIDMVADVSDEITLICRTKRNRKPLKVSVYQKHSHDVGSAFQANVVTIMPWLDQQLCAIETTAILDNLGFCNDKPIATVTQDSEFTFGACKYTLQVDGDGLVFSAEPVIPTVQRRTRG